MNFEILTGYKLNKTFKKDKIFFYHIPKCAGLSFTRALRPLLESVRIAGWCHKYPPEILSKKSFIDDVKRKLNYTKLNIDFDIHQANQAYSSNKVYYENFQFLSGHLPFNFYSNINNRLTLTLMREPISRVISNYQFWIQKGFINKNEDLEKLLDRKILKSNLITEFFSEENKPNINVALNNIKKIDFVVDVVDINKLLNYLISYLELPNIILTKENITEKKINLNDSQIELIKKYNGMDCDLYNKIKDFTFKFDQYENNPQRNNIFYSFYSSKKIFNNTESLIFDDSHLGFVLDHLKKI